jgi:hypothetical protein
MVDPPSAEAVRQCCQGGVEDQTFPIASTLQTRGARSARTNNSGKFRSDASIHSIRSARRERNRRRLLQRGDVQDQRVEVGLR